MKKWQLASKRSFADGLIIVDAERVPDKAIRFIKNVRITPDDALEKRTGSTYVSDASYTRYANTSIADVTRIDHDGTALYIVDPDNRKIVKYDGSTFSLYDYGWREYPFMNIVGGSRDFLGNVDTKTVYYLVSGNRYLVGSTIKDVRQVWDKANSEYSSQAVFWTDDNLFIWDASEPSYAFESWTTLGISGVRSVDAYQSGTTTYFWVTTQDNLYLVTYDGSSWSTTSIITYSNFSATDIIWGENPTGSVDYIYVLGTDTNNGESIRVVSWDGSSASETNVTLTNTGAEKITADRVNKDLYVLLFDLTVDKYDYDTTTVTYTSTITLPTSYETINTLNIVAYEDEILQHLDKEVIKQDYNGNLNVLYHYYDSISCGDFVSTHKGMVLLRKDQRPLLYHQTYGVLPLSLEEQPSVWRTAPTGSNNKSFRMRLVWVIEGTANSPTYAIYGDWTSAITVDPTAGDFKVLIPADIFVPEDGDLYFYGIIWDDTDGEWRMATEITAVVPGQILTISSFASSGDIVSTNGLLPPSDSAPHSYVGEYHYGRLVLAQDNKIYWSDVDVSVFDTTYWYLEVGDRSPIVALKSWRRNLYIFKENGEIWILRKEFPSFSPDASGTREALGLILEKVTGNAGKIFPYSVKANEKGIYFANRDNAFIFNGYAVYPLGIGLENLLSDLDNDEVFGAFYNDEYGQFYVLSCRNRLSESTLPEPGFFRVYFPEYNNYKLTIYNTQTDSLITRLNLNDADIDSPKVITSDETGVYVVGSRSGSTTTNDIAKFDYNGNLLWSYRAGIGNANSSSVFLDGQYLWYPVYDGNNKLKGINKTTGVLEKEVNVGSYAGFSGTTPSIVWLHNERYFISGDTDILVDLQTNTEYTLPVTNVRRVMFYKGYFYIYDSGDDKLCKVKASNGTTAWIQTVSDFDYGICGISNNALYYIDTNSNIVFRSLADGGLKKTISVPATLNTIKLVGVDYDEDIWVLGYDADSNWYIYKYDTSNATWKQITTWNDNSVGNLYGYHFITPITYGGGEAWRY